MNLVHMISIFTISVALMISTEYGFFLCKKAEDKIWEKRKQVESYKFISESFENACQGKGFDSLIQWQKTCRAMWNLNYIGWSKASDFMIVNDKNDSVLMYGTWKSESYNGEIYSAGDKKLFE